MSTKVPRSKENDYTREWRRRAGASSRIAPAPRSSMSAATRSIRRCCRATSRTSWASPRCRSGWPGRFRINGEHAQGDFYIPMATSEGTLVASYNRGMRLLAKAAASRPRSWRVPCSARRSSSSTMRSRAREFGEWVGEHFEEIRAVAETTTSRASSQNRPVLDRPAAQPALQLHDRRCGRPEHDRQGHAGGLRVDPGELSRAAASTSCRATSTPTRSTRRSTCC